MIATANENNWWSVLFAHGNLGIGLATSETTQASAPIKFQHSVGFVKMYRAIHSAPSGVLGKTPMSVDAQGFLDGFPESPEAIEDIIWLSAAAELSDLYQIRALLKAIREMNRDERERLFSSDIAIESLSYIFNKIWTNEADKPDKSQDWDSVLSFLDETKELGNLPEAFPLQVIQARIRSIVMADYLKATCNDALVDLYSLPSTNHPTLTFLINYSIANCLFIASEQPHTALKYITNAIKIEPTGFAYLYLQSWQIATVLNSRLENWDEAERQCLLAIRSAATQPELARYERIEIKGELAWIYWSQGNKQKACKAMFSCVIGLVQCYYDPSDKRFRESFNKIAHGLGWFTSMAHFGTPPPATQTGEPYMDIIPGIFAIRNFKLGDHIPPLGFSRTMVLEQLALFADSVGLSRMAWKLYNLIDSIEEDCPNPVLVNMRNMNNAHLAVRFGTLPDAIHWGLRSVNSFIVAQGRTKLDVDIFDPQVTVEECMDLVSLETRKTIEHELLYMVFLPAFINMMGDDTPYQKVKEKIEEFDLLLVNNETSFYDFVHWKKVIAFFKQLIPMWDGQNHVDREALEIPENHSFLVITWMLLESKRRGLSPRERLIIQFQAINKLFDYPNQSRYMWKGIGKFLHQYWSEYPGFSLRNPEAMKSDLRQIPTNLGEKTSAGIIMRVCLAVDATLQQEGFARFQQIAQFGLY